MAAKRHIGRSKRIRAYSVSRVAAAANLICKRLVTYTAYQNIMYGARWQAGNNVACLYQQAAATTAPAYAKSSAVSA